MLYWLMRKDDVLLALDIAENGSILRVSEERKNEEYLPLAYRRDRINGIRRWWSERSVPIGQGRVKEMLEEKGMHESSEYLLNNLGLSLTDYYWIRPVHSSLRWADVNLYDNNFRENLLVRIESSSPGSFTPNSTVQGQLEKSWQIRKGKRVLIKGNSDQFSCESFNELFACLLHRQQGYQNYTRYRLLKIRNRPYSFGCYSEAFTNQQLELVSAWAVITSEKQPKNQRVFDHFLKLCEKNGADPSLLRRDLDYMIMTDFILSNRDRHMNNIALLRDADTLKFLRLAPVFDTGKSMFVRRTLPVRYADLIDGDISSFTAKEQKQLSLVSDKSLVDSNKLPTSSQLADLYRKDEKIPQERIDLVCSAYEQKVRAFQDWQNS